MASPSEIIAASDDLRRLVDDGFEVDIRYGHLLISSVPYLAEGRRVARGTLILVLNLPNGEKTGRPPDHVAFFIGSKPHYSDGTPINGIIHEQGAINVATDLVANFRFSSRPADPDPDYYHKVNRYVTVLSDEARVIDCTATAQTRRIVENLGDESPFVFADTNSARAQITAISQKLNDQRIAIVGLGGTGTYILDFVAKTPVREIHLFDDDEYSLHNSFRSPGAPTAEQLRARQRKVNYFREIYSRMHKRIIAHPERATVTNLATFSGMTFVFLSMDPGPDKEALVQHLVTSRIPFVDCGLAIEAQSDQLIGIVNTITVTPAYHQHLAKVPLKAVAAADLYTSNIQIAELNALNAILAVIRWKKLFGFYVTQRHEHECTYTVGPNMLTNEEISD
jgi:hypothetical protein